MQGGLNGVLGAIRLWVQSHVRTKKADGCGGLNGKMCVLALAGGVYLSQDKLQCI